MGHSGLFLIALGVKGLSGNVRKPISVQIAATSLTFAGYACPQTASIIAAAFSSGDGPDIGLGRISSGTAEGLHRKLAGQPLLSAGSGCAAVAAMPCQERKGTPRHFLYQQRSLQCRDFPGPEIQIRRYRLSAIPTGLSRRSVAAFSLTCLRHGFCCKKRYA